MAKSYTFGRNSAPTALKGITPEKQYRFVGVQCLSAVSAPVQDAETGNDGTVEADGKTWVDL